MEMGLEKEGSLKGGTRVRDQHSPGSGLEQDSSEAPWKLALVGRKLPNMGPASCYGVAEFLKGPARLLQHPDMFGRKGSRLESWRLQLGVGNGGWRAVIRGKV